MDTIFMNSENRKTSDSHRLLHKYVALSTFSTYNKWKNIKMSYYNTKFKILAPP